MLSPRGVFLHSGYDRRLSFGSLNAREEKYLSLLGLNTALETAARAGYCGSRDLNSISRSTFKFMLVNIRMKINYYALTSAVSTSQI